MRRRRVFLSGLVAAVLGAGVASAETVDLERAVPRQEDLTWCTGVKNREVRDGDAFREGLEDLAAPASTLSAGLEPPVRLKRDRDTWNGYRYEVRGKRGATVTLSLLPAEVDGLLIPTGGQLVWEWANGKVVLEPGPVGGVDPDPTWSLEAFVDEARAGYGEAGAGRAGTREGAL